MCSFFSRDYSTFLAEARKILLGRDKHAAMCHLIQALYEVEALATVDIDALLSQALDRYDLILKSDFVFLPDYFS